MTCWPGVAWRPLPNEGGGTGEVRLYANDVTTYLGGYNVHADAVAALAIAKNNLALGRPVGEGVPLSDRRAAREVASAGTRAAALAALAMLSPEGVGEEG